ncbi:hypothetical protein GBAR_LOCUS30420 [Geodia barretti]|uniref:Uncharacterized protein n=1 Tax=Geodia barretti TaxID=519541 RepID=A0AA35TWJ2_GEOBA|nr:hypothetical protein GBAR_LOCUS30420 [Geodia barretti]
MLSSSSTSPPLRQVVAAGISSPELLHVLQCCSLGPVKLDYHLPEARWRIFIEWPRVSLTEQNQCRTLFKLFQILIVGGHFTSTRVESLMFLSQFSDQVVEQIRCEVVPVEVEGSKQLKMVFALPKSLVILFEK